MLKRCSQPERTERPRHKSTLVSRTVDGERETFRLYRSCIEHEDHLIHHRTTSFVTVQGFMVASLGLSIGSDSHNLYLQWLLGVGGIASSLVTLVSIHAAAGAVKELEKRGRRVLGCPDTSRPHIPPLAGGGSCMATRLGKAPAFGLPVFFALFWVAELCLTWLGLLEAHCKP